MNIEQAKLIIQLIDVAISFNLTSNTAYNKIKDDLILFIEKREAPEFVHSPPSDMLPPSYRPLYDGEIICDGDEYLCHTGEWIEHSSNDLRSSVGDRISRCGDWLPHRTKRPL